MRKQVIMTDFLQLLPLATFCTVLKIQSVYFFLNQHVFSKCVDIFMTQVEGKQCWT